MATKSTDPPARSASSAQRVADAASGSPTGRTSADRRGRDVPEVGQHGPERRRAPPAPRARPRRRRPPSADRSRSRGRAAARGRWPRRAACRRRPRTGRAPARRGRVKNSISRAISRGGLLAPCALRARVPQLRRIGRGPERLGEVEPLLAGQLVERVVGVHAARLVAPRQLARGTVSRAARVSFGRWRSWAGRRELARLAEAHSQRGRRGRTSRVAPHRTRGHRCHAPHRRARRDGCAASTAWSSRAREPTSPRPACRSRPLRTRLVGALAPPGTDDLRRVVGTAGHDLAALLPVSPSGSTRLGSAARQHVAPGARAGRAASMEAIVGALERLGR